MLVEGPAKRVIRLAGLRLWKLEWNECAERLENTKIAAELRGHRQQTEPKPVRAVAT